MFAPFSEQDFLVDPDLYMEILHEVQSVLEGGLTQLEINSSLYRAVEQWADRAATLETMWVGEDEKMGTLVRNLKQLIFDITSVIPTLLLQEWTEATFDNHELAPEDSWSLQDDPDVTGPEEEGGDEPDLTGPEEEAEDAVDKAGEMLVTMAAKRVGPSTLPILPNAPTTCYEPNESGIVDVKTLGDGVVMQMIEGFPDSAYCSSLKEIISFALTDPSKIFYRCEGGQIFRDKRIVNMYPLASLYAPFEDVVNVLQNGAEILVFSRTDRKFEETSSESFLQGMQGAAFSGHHCGSKTDKRIYDVAGYVLPNEMRKQDEKKETKEREKKKEKKKETKVNRKQVRKILREISQLTVEIPRALLSEGGVWEDMVVKGKKRLNVGLFDLSPSTIREINQLLQPLDVQVVRKALYRGILD